MTPGALPRLVRLSLRKDPRAALSSIFGVAVGIAALVFFVSLGLGVSRVLRTKVFPLDARLVEVVPSPLALGGLLGGGMIDEGTVERLAALPGVQRAYRKMSVRVPAVSRYSGDFFGNRINMGVEVVAVGVDKELVAADLQLGDFSDPGPGQPLPAVVASRLLELYNKTFAPARSLPQLSAAMVAGFSFPVEFNRSFVTQAPPGPTLPYSAQVVGVSDRGLLAGLTLPLETARRLNRETGKDTEHYSAVTLQAVDPSEVPRLVSEVKAMGLKVDDTEVRMGQNAGAAVAVATSAMALLSLLICALAAINIAHALSAAVRSRSRDIALLRAVGASRADIRAWVFGEALVLGLCGAALGTAAALLGVAVVDALALRLLPEFPFKPEAFFQVPWAWLPLALLLGVAAALGGAFFPARRAAQVDPARALAGG